MRRLGSVFALIVGSLALTTSVAVGEEKLALGKRGEVEFRTATRVGQTLLQPGHYRFQHEMAADGQHALVIRARATVQSTGNPGDHYAGRTLDEPVARVPCQVVTLARKPGSTKIVNTVTQIHISGEKAGHILVLTPTS